MSIRQKLDTLERDAAAETDDRHRVQRVMGRILNNVEAAELANELARRLYHPGEPLPPDHDPALAALSREELSRRLARWVEDPAEVTA